MNSKLRFIIGPAWALCAQLLVAAPGDLIRNVNLPVPGYGVSVGVDCDGAIYFTLDQDSRLHRMDRNGTLQGSVQIRSTQGSPLFIDEISWDNSRKVFWAQEHNTNPIRVYQLNPGTGVATFVFAGSSSVGSFRDGIAYDGTDDTLWISGDVSDTVEHFKTDGTFLGSITPKNASGGTLGAISGVAVGFGDLLYLGQNGRARIVNVRKSNGDFLGVFASPGGARDEGLECDAISFFPKLALWSREFNTPGFISAIEVEPGTCACQVRNTELIGLEVTQVVQDWNNSVPLIAGKPTFVRAHIQPTGPDEVRVTPLLRGYRNEVELPESPQTVLNTSGYITARHNTAGLRDIWYASANFQLPESWLQGTLDLRVEAAGLACKEVTGTPNDCAVRVSFETAYDPGIKMVGVGWSKDGQDHSPTADDIASAVKQIESTYPITKVDWNWDSNIEPLLFPTKPSNPVEFMRVWTMVLEYSVLDKLHGSCAQSCPKFYMGVIAGEPDICQFFCSSGLGIGHSVTVGYPADRLTMPHELGHNLGRKHVNCSGDEFNTDGDYPYPGGKISFEVTGDNAFFGLDTSSEFGPRPIRPTTGDLMSYCFQWPSDYTYMNLYEALKDRYAGASARQNVAQIGPALSAEVHVAVIAGIVSVTQPTGEIFSVWRTLGRIPVSNSTTGSCAIKLYDTVGLELASYEFQPEQLPDGGDLTPFGMLIPFPTNTFRVSLVRGNALLDSRTASAHIPTITVVSPNGGENLTGSATSISWLGQDADGDRLTYAIEYSRDGGRTWKPLTIDWPLQTYQVDLNFLEASSNALIRVFASDGFHTAEDASNGSFSVPNHPPTALIQSPTEAELFTGIQIVSIQGSAHDIEDGQLDGPSLQWKSGRDGFLGAGAHLLLSATDLSQGAHEISVTATDSVGLSVTSIVHIVVAREILLRSADLTVTKTASPDVVTPGGNVTYTIALRNNGPDSATNIVVTDVLPPNVSLVSASPGCSETLGVVTCTIPVLNSGDITSLTITATPLVTGTFTNIVTVTNDVVDPIPANNAASVSFSSMSVADLSLRKFGMPDIVRLGSNVVYTLSITNNGPSTAEGVVVTDRLPNGVTFVSAPTGCSESAAVVTCNLGTLSNGASASITILVTAANAGILTNAATVAGSGIDPVTQNNSDFATTAVVSSSCASVEAIIASVNGANLDGKNKRPLIATLQAACSSLDRINAISGANQLHAFQNKVRAQISPFSPALAEQWIRAAQEIIDSVGGLQVKPRAQRTNGGTKISFAGVFGQQYAIQASTNLIDWVILGAANDTGNGQFELEDNTNIPYRFYRAVVP